MRGKRVRGNLKRGRERVKREEEKRAGRNQKKEIKGRNRVDIES